VSPLQSQTRCRTCQKHFSPALWLSSILSVNGSIDKRCELPVVCIAAYIMQSARIRRLLRSIIQSLVNICLSRMRERERRSEGWRGEGGGGGGLDGPVKWKSKSTGAAVLGVEASRHRVRPEFSSVNHDRPLASACRPAGRLRKRAGMQMRVTLTEFH
jgi:hypothetical protein